MNRIDRLLGLLTFLQSKRYVTAERIAEHYSISLRTVYRDLKALNEQGIPVGFEANKGYFVVQGYFLPPVSFTTEEANAFVLLEAIVSGFTDNSIKANYTTALHKIKSVLRSSQKEKVDHLDRSTMFQMPPCYNTNYDYLAPLQNAISAKTIIEIDYKNNNNEVSHRRTEPIGLFFYAFNWHLIAWCHIRNDYRDFRVSRILKVRDTGMPFIKEAHLSLADYQKLLPVDY